MQHVPHSSRVMLVFALAFALGCSRGVRGQHELPPPATPPEPIAQAAAPAAEAPVPPPVTPASGNGPTGARQQANVFLSGHSAFGLIMPAMLDQIARNEGRQHAYNLQMGLGSSLKWRLSGKGHEQDRNGKARALDVHEELPNPKTIGSGQRYDTFVVTEAVPVVGQILFGDSISQLREFYELFTKSDPRGTVYFFDTWEKVEPSMTFTAWADKTRAKQVVWQCIADAANRAPELAKNPIQMLPAGLSLARAVEAAEKGEIPGVRPEQIFADDRHHLSALGNFYVALTVYSSIYRRPVERAPLTFTTPQGQQSGFVSQEAATRMQRIAWDTVREFYASPPPARSMESCRTQVTRLGCEAGGDCPRKVAESFSD